MERQRASELALASAVLKTGALHFAAKIISLTHT